MPEVILSVHQLCKEVPDAPGTLSILRDVEFSLLAGQTVAVIGASGSGKSTLLSLLAGLDVPTSGEVVLAGQSLFALNEDQRAAVRARLVGFVFQSFQLLPHLTALENVMLPMELAAWPDAVERARAMLERVGLGERLRHVPKLMSGGEQQRVALARAFVMQPRLLLADEPTGNLDSKSADAVFELLRRINREQAMAVLFVTHNAALAARCDRVIRVVDGRVV